MKMKLMQILLLVAAVLCTIAITVALSSSDPQGADRYEPSSLMQSLGRLIGPRMLDPDDLTHRHQAFPSRLRLPPGTEKTFKVASSGADQRRVVFRISGTSPALTITYDVDDDQRFNGRGVDDRQWQQAGAEEPQKARFVIFDQGGELSFSNTGNRSAGVTLRMEE